MSTTIYSATPLSPQEIQSKVKQCAKNELVWLIREVVIPQLPQIKENLQSCFDKLSDTNDQEYRLPLSTHNSEMLKGIIVRQNFSITGLSIAIKSKNLNGGKIQSFKLQDGKPLIIRQLLDCHDSMYNAIHTIDKILENPELDTSILIKYIDQVYNQIGLAKNSLNTPKDEYLFPKLRVPFDLFTPELPGELSLDFLVSNSDLSIDLKILRKVTTKPWDTILDPSKKLTWVDHVRSRISTDRYHPINRIIMEEYTKLLEWKKEQEKYIQSTSGDLPNDSKFGSTIIKSIFNSSTSDPSISTLLKTASKFLEESVTYIDNDGQPSVVTVIESCDVMTSDPVLLSMSIKLESLEKSASKLLDNLKNCL